MTDIHTSSFVSIDQIQCDTWREHLMPFFDRPEFGNLENHLLQRARGGVKIFPPAQMVFHAFNTAPFHRVKVIILGQDPYHGVGQAMGLSFSVPSHEKAPPSLRNIFKEIESDLGGSELNDPDLTPWATQGVLLLNAVLTVEEKQANSHSSIGWEGLTDLAIESLSREREGLVFILWGGFAQKKAKLIDGTKHFILSAPHPSPLSSYRGFFGCRHFSKANEYLLSQGQSPIDW